MDASLPAGGPIGLQAGAEAETAMDRPPLDPAARTGHSVGPRGAADGHTAEHCLIGCRHVAKLTDRPLPALPPRPWPPTPGAGRALSFTHAVRVIKRKMPQAAAVPP